MALSTSPPAIFCVKNRAREGSEYGQLIAEYIKEGKIVPQEVTIALLRNAMKKAIVDRFETPGFDPETDGPCRFLVDGFPRKMDQALKFEEDVAVARFVLYFECPEEVMLKRLLKRGETSGRIDDNVESIRKRFHTFIDTSMPVIEYFDKAGKVAQDLRVTSPLAMSTASPARAGREDGHLNLTLSTKGIK